jgi:uncharacterized linocin/CFP29 family protein
MDILKRNLAPVADEAWEEINTVAAQVLKANLSARKVVDFDGPKGWDFAAVPLGRLDIPAEGKKGDVNYGMRTVQPLVETRVMFDLNVWELDNAVRGAEDIDLAPLETAARKIALFEEKAIYEGHKAGNITGMLKSAVHSPQTFTGKPGNLISAVSAGIAEFAKAGVKGPYRLICGPKLWQEVSSQSDGYPLTRRLEKLLDSEIILNPFLEDTLLVSVRGGDMKLTVGVDFSIGFNSADAEKVRLYLTESFTFRVLDGAAIIPINRKK